MEVLEQRSKMCANKIRVMRQQYVSENDVKCYNCSGHVYECEQHQPVSVAQIPINQGLFYIPRIIRRA